MCESPFCVIDVDGNVVEADLETRVARLLLRGLTEEDLRRSYHTQVDPRLNYEQALEMALLISRRAAQVPRQSLRVAV